MPSLTPSPLLPPPIVTGCPSIESKAFALAETNDTGKPIEESEGDIDDAVEYLRCSIGSLSACVRGRCKICVVFFCAPISDFGFNFDPM